MNTVLRIKNLEKRYHLKDGEIKALDDISFDVKSGEFISIVGPSGCGKSTLLSIIGGLEKKSKGILIYNKYGTKIAYMLQDDTLFPWLTVLENCLIGLKIQKLYSKEKKKDVIRLLEKYGLKEFINSYPNALSGGMRQRVALIRTLTINPDILLLDESFSALDHQARIKVSNDVYNIIKQENKTAIMVTHNISEAITMSDRVIVLTKRPSSVKKIYNIKLKEKSDPIKNRNDDNFRKYYEEIWNELEVQNE